jgi:hypothetical protein
MKTVKQEPNTEDPGMLQKEFGACPVGNQESLMNAEW